MAAVAPEDQGATLLFAALAPDPQEFLNLPHAYPSPSTTTTTQALKGLTDQQVCGHPASSNPSPLAYIQTPPRMASC